LLAQFFTVSVIVLKDFPRTSAAALSVSIGWLPKRVRTLCPMVVLGVSVVFSAVFSVDVFVVASGREPTINCKYSSTSQWPPFSDRHSASGPARAVFYRQRNSAERFSQNLCRRSFRERRLVVQKGQDALPNGCPGRFCSLFCSHFCSHFCRSFCRRLRPPRSLFPSTGRIFDSPETFKKQAADLPLKFPCGSVALGAFDFEEMRFVGFGYFQQQLKVAV
ncbi:MAG: hypothetical protein LBU79_04620, partial [Planctomycetota bacterium]|nr:hypothetical protein [Planctomycetota bacterium]